MRSRNVTFEPGKISAVANANGKIVAQDEIETAGEAKAIKLTPHAGPNGLQADGSDVAFFDVEVVDAQGRRCPTDEARVDFKVDGPAIWRGGYNSGKPDSDQQPLSRHRMRHQPRRHPLHAHARRHHPDRHARRPCAGDGDG